MMVSFSVGKRGLVVREIIARSFPSLLKLSIICEQLKV